jgi:hypothetical protein
MTWLCTALGIAAPCRNPRVGGLIPPLATFETLVGASPTGVEPTTYRLGGGWSNRTQVAESNSDPASLCPIISGFFGPVFLENSLVSANIIRRLRVS